MQLLHGLGPVAGEHLGQYAQGVVDALVQQLLLATRRAAEDEAGDQAGVARMALWVISALLEVSLDDGRCASATAILPLLAYGEPPYATSKKPSTLLDV